MKKHPVHRYQKAKLGKLTVWRCIFGGCLHYIHDGFIVGQESICRCGRKFTITKDKQRRKTPKCDMCQSSASLAQRGIIQAEEMKAEAKEKIQEINIDDLLEGLE